ncbi:unnamed protein product [Spirodela intermedia]|uniref:Uncharacterized protein n=1 Tax=Spirodela intermedia TaxID=51605 RepID=A0A7I8JMZ2_SPIIN|nr:unnamed protein product [Spirodela intermedia]CAA6671518.1 unnamed protein product [Spirodela intermedia]
METPSSPSSASSAASEDESSTFDELSMEESLLFSDSLKDLRNLRSQLYSAAEYFELSYTNDDQKQTVVDTLKDYTVKAIVNTVDHLGSVSCKVNGLLGEKVDEVSGAELRVTCIEQRLRTCQGLIDQEGLSQQSLVITTPKYHKRYILPVGESMPGSGRHAVAHCEEAKWEEEMAEPRPLQNSNPAARPLPQKFRSLSPSQRGRSSSPLKKGRSPSPSPQLGRPPFSENRSGSPIPASNPNLLARSGSLSRRQSAPNPSGTGLWFSMDPRKSASVRQHDDRDDQKDSEQNSSKTKRLFKALLSRRKSRRDDMLYAYLDEY